jgi:predicted Zn-dependent peptidase
MTLLDTVVSYRLDNGLRVTLSEDRRLPLAAVCVWYDVGARDEPAGRTGMAHLAEHMMFQGSANVGANEHTRYVQSVGGATNGDTTLESTHFVDSVPAHQLRPVLWLEADRMASVAASLTDDRVENQRQVVINERLQRYESQPLALAWERVQRLAHPEGHPYQHVPAGSLADLRAITVVDLRGFLSRYHTPSNAVLSVVGDFDTATARSWIDEYFGPIPSAGAPPRRPDPPPVRLPTPVTEQTRLAIPHAGLLCAYRLPPAGAADSDAVELAVAVLAGGRHGRLHRELVTARSLATDVRLGQIGLSRAPSLALLGMPVAPGVRPAALSAAADAALARIAGEGPTELELVVARHRLERRGLERLVTVEGRAVELARSFVAGDPALARVRPHRFDAVGEAEVSTVVGRYFVAANRVLLSHLGVAGARRGRVLVST